MTQSVNEQEISGNQPDPKQDETTQPENSPAEQNNENEEAEEGDEEAQQAEAAS